VNKGRVQLGLRNQSYARIMQHIYDTREIVTAGVTGQIDAIEALQGVATKLNEFGTVLRDEITITIRAPRTGLRRKGGV